jgi:hypothetical protein
LFYKGFLHHPATGAGSFSERNPAKSGQIPANSPTQNPTPSASFASRSAEVRRRQGEVSAPSLDPQQLVVL